MEFISLKEDFAFKEFFEHEGVRKQFISDVLGISLETIRSARLGATGLRKRWKLQKQGFMDILVELNDDTKIDIEMQVEKQKYWYQRNLFYLARMFTDDLVSGDEYTKLRRCVTISILDFNLNDDNICHSVYKLRDQIGREYSNLFEIHIIELKKIPDENDAVKDWIKLFNVKSEEEMNMLAKANLKMKEATEVLRSINIRKEFRFWREGRIKARRDRYAREEYVRDEGKIEGTYVTLASNVDSLMTCMKCDIVTACRMLGVPEEEYHKAKKYINKAIDKLDK